MPTPLAWKLLPPPPPGGGGGVGVSPWDTPLYPCSAHLVKLFFQKKITIFQTIFLDVFQVVKRKRPRPVQVHAKKKVKKSVRKMLTIGSLGCKLYA